MENDIAAKADNELLALLSRADSSDLDLFVDYITDGGDGRLALAGEVCKKLVTAKREQTYTAAVIELLLRELKHFGGNSFVNLFRSNGVPYSEIVFDVLEHVGGKRDEQETVADAELKIVSKIFATVWEKLTSAQRSELEQSLDIKLELAALSTGDVQKIILMGGNRAINITRMLSAAMGSSTLGGGVAMGANLVAGRVAGVALGPIGLALSGIWGAYSLTSPAYRITLPCVVLIAYIRLKRG
jgi:uncharacterized protein YaaW (UPF0174 family)